MAQLGYMTRTGMKLAYIVHEAKVIVSARRSCDALQNDNDACRSNIVQRSAPKVLNMPRSTFG